jgi:hypothetical protein
MTAAARRSLQLKIRRHEDYRDEFVRLAQEWEKAGEPGKATDRFEHAIYYDNIVQQLTAQLREEQHQ